MARERAGHLLMTLQCFKIASWEARRLWTTAVSSLATADPSMIHPRTRSLSKAHQGHRSLALLLVCASLLSGCGLLVQEAVKEAVKAGEYGEECLEDGSCEDGLTCVFALAVDEGQDESLGYRCLQSCQTHTECGALKHHKTCCAMQQQTRTTKACFRESDERCISPIILPPGN